MAKAYIDRIDNLAAKEQHGIVRQLTRKARVIFTGQEVITNNSYNILGAALDFLDTQGITPMSVLSSVDASNPRWGALTLVRREPALAESATSNCVDVVLDYQHVIDGANQTFRPVGGYSPNDDTTVAGNPSGSIFGKGKCSIVDKTTNFFYPNGDRSDKLKKTQIVVAHTFPLWETGIAATAFDPDFPRTIIQGGEISLPFPQSNYSFSAIVATNDPTTIANQLVASVSQYDLMGQPPLTWICSEVKWECNSPAGNPFVPAANYNMSFEFQNNIDGWDATVVFIDPRTGRPPSGVEQATDTDANGVLRIFNSHRFSLGNPLNLQPAGIWDVPALRRVDFESYFNTLFR